MQINPPFDGSSPCPMCSQEIRSLSSYAHNMLNRWRKGETLPEPKFWVKLDDLTRCAAGEAGYSDPAMPRPPIDAIESDNAEVRTHLDAIRAIVTEYRKHSRPTSHETATAVAASLSPLVDALRGTMPAVGKLSEAHFDDDRHASGRDNILRSQNGYSPDRGGDYNWTVEVVKEGADLVHTVCGTGLKLHQVFKDKLAKDCEFYGSVWCPTCRINTPAAQFDRVA